MLLGEVPVASNPPSRVREGSPAPHGAIWDVNGRNITLLLAHATKVEVCLFDSAANREQERIALPQSTDQVWHGYIPNVEPGSVYGYRVHMHRGQARDAEATIHDRERRRRALQSIFVAGAVGRCSECPTASACPLLPDRGAQCAGGIYRVKVTANARPRPSRRRLAIKRRGRSPRPTGS
jgi:hypothetical protein